MVCHDFVLALIGDSLNFEQGFEVYIVSLNCPFHNSGA
jgi:hypothetical protein